MNFTEERNLFLQTIKNGLEKVFKALNSLKLNKSRSINALLETLLEFEVKLYEIEIIFKKLYKLADNMTPDFSSAISNFLGHRRLTEKEYYLLCAEKILEYTGADGLNEAQRFDMHCYETDKSYSHIMPSKTPESGGWGIEPEKVEMKFLRPEQKEYFAKYDPKTYKRFRH